MPSKLQFVVPHKRLARRADEFKQEFFDHDEYVIHGSGLYDAMDYAEWLALTVKNADPLQVSEDWVTTDTYFVMRSADQRIVGIIDVRHSIDHPFLAAYGGHIGYSVRPDERGKGYGNTMLKMALQHAKKLGLKRVMLGCYSSNIASRNLIVANGGKHTETKPFEDGEPVDIFWIDLK